MQQRSAEPSSQLMLAVLDVSHQLPAQAVLNPEVQSLLQGFPTSHGLPTGIHDYGLAQEIHFTSRMKITTNDKDKAETDLMLCKAKAQGRGEKGKAEPDSRQNLDSAIQCLFLPCNLLCMYLVVPVGVITSWYYYHFML